MLIDTGTDLFGQSNRLVGPDNIKQLLSKVQRKKSFKLRHGTNMIILLLYGNVNEGYWCSHFQSKVECVATISTTLSCASLFNKNGIYTHFDLLTVFICSLQCKMIPLSMSPTNSTLVLVMICQELLLAILLSISLAAHATQPNALSCFCLYFLTIHIPLPYNAALQTNAFSEQLPHTIISIQR